MSLRGRKCRDGQRTPVRALEMSEGGEKACEGYTIAWRTNRVQEGCQSIRGTGCTLAGH